VDALAHQDGRDGRERVVAEAVERGHRLCAVIEAVAADDVGAVVDRFEELRQLLHRVGVVAVGRDDDRAVGR